jgi:tellurite resistance protein TerC
VIMVTLVVTTAASLYKTRVHDVKKDAEKDAEKEALDSA